MDRVIYRRACRKANILINDLRSRSNFDKIERCGVSTRKKWSTIKDILHPPSCTTIRTPGKKEDLARLLSNFFADKVDKFRSAIDQRLEGKQPDPTRANKLFIGKPLSGLKQVLHTEVKQMLDAMIGKSSPRDFISTTLLKDCSGVFASVIARLANLSFAEGLFPIQFKTAQVTPIVKKTGIDTSNPASYRPISNLNTISKVLKRLFQSRLIPHVSPSICSLQSAYRQFHSTETVVLKIASDLFEATESGCVNMLVAIDLLAAFDTIDHQARAHVWHQGTGPQLDEVLS